MNCKPLYRGSVTLPDLKKVSKKVLHAIAACLFDNIPYLGIRDKVCLLLPDAYVLSEICEKYGIDEVDVIEQYPFSMFYEPYKCNFRVRIHSNRIYSVYSNVE